MILLLITVISLASYSEGFTRCFECTDSPNPADCTRTTLCTEEQQCTLKQYITSGGLVLYSSGCLSKTWCSNHNKREARQSLTKRSDIVTCEECCSGELCNNNGCGLNALPLSQRGPYCFDCPLLSDPAACRTLTSCSQGQVCMLHVKPSSASGSTVYTSSCASASDCHSHRSAVAIGKRNNIVDPYITSSCHTCCDTDFCNDHCGTMVTTTPSSTVHSATTSLRTTIGMSSSTAVPSTTTALPASQRGPYCYNCPVLTDPAACRTIMDCYQGEDCHSHSSAVAIGKRNNIVDPYITNSCHTCCDTDFCNDHCGTMVTTTPRYIMHSSITSLKTTIGLPSSTTVPTTNTVTVTSINTDLNKADCERDGYTFVEHLRFCFKLHYSGHKTWNEANDRCKKEGGTLGVLDTEAKWNFVKTVASKHSHYREHRIYIGLADEYRTNNFIWLDGTSFSFSAWGRRQPSDGRGKCVVLQTDDHFTWADTTCTEAYSYICSKKVL